jgi:uncharacterized protein YjbI with pentapeptide repeats
VKLHQTKQRLDAGNADLSGSRFDNVNLSGSDYRNINMFKPVPHEGIRHLRLPRLDPPPTSGG